MSLFVCLSVCLYARLQTSAPNDLSWGQIQYVGAQRAVAQFANTNTPVVVLQAQAFAYDPPDYDALRNQTYALITQQSANLIIFSSFNYIGFLQWLMPDALQRFPNVYLAIIDQGVSDPEPLANTIGVVFGEDQSSFLGGMLAATVTATKRVFVQASYGGSTLMRFMNGFSNGVKYVCPSCIVVMDWHLSFTDSGEGAQIAHWLTEQEKADVVFCAAGSAGIAVWQVAMTYTQRPTWGLAVDTDSFDILFNVTSSAYVSSSALPLLPNRYLGSVIKRIDNAVFDMISYYASGQLRGAQNWLFDSEHATTRVCCAAPAHSRGRSCCALCVCVSLFQARTTAWA
jgi:basic membrane lipoprotein Med (substrate-binding protein (PBP1-ABC) superfamily)